MSFQWYFNLQGQICHLAGTAMGRRQAVMSKSMVTNAGHTDTGQKRVLQNCVACHLAIFGDLHSPDTFHTCHELCFCHLSTNTKGGWIKDDQRRSVTFNTTQQPGKLGATWWCPYTTPALPGCRATEGKPCTDWWSPSRPSGGRSVLRVGVHS